MITLSVGMAVVPATPARAGIPVGGMAAGDLNALFNAYGNAGDHWTGADGTTSVALPDGRVVWLFSDTFLGTVNADYTRPKYSPMVNNTMVVQDGTQLVKTLHGGTPAEPRAYVTPTSQNGEFFWPADGMVEGGALKVLLSKMRVSGGGVLDFEVVGNALATINLPSLTVASVVDLPVPSTINWGSALLSDGSYTYVYGTSSAPGRMKFAHLARATAGALGGPWEFWTGSGWSSDAAAAGRLMSGVGTAYGVQKIGTQYVLVTHENNLLFDSQIALYTASSPTGPFTGPRYVYTAPEVSPDTKKVVYDVRLHPELARSGKLLLSYNVNSLTYSDLLADARLYRPRFIEVDWPLTSSSGTPTAPTGLSVTGQDDTAQLSWTAVPGATSYRVYQRDVTGGQTHFARLPAPVAATSQSVGLLIPGHAYEFKVSAVNSAGEGSLSTVASLTLHSTKPVADVIGYAGSPEAIAGSYLVSLRPTAVPQENLETFSRQLLAQYGGTLGRLFPLTLFGFSAELTEAQARDLASHPDVTDVEQNVMVSLDSAGQQGGAPWHLDRIDQRDTNLDGLFRYPNTGEGVTAYVVDSGIGPGHPQFSGRVGVGFNGIDLSTDTTDCFGHGTEVSGVLAGSTSGVAKGVNIVPVKVFGCTGKARNDSVVTGIEWVARNAEKPAVVNLSFGVSGRDKARVKRSVESLIRQKLTVVTSAGNTNSNACLQAPKDVPGVIVVGGTARGGAPGYPDVRLDEGAGRGSNYGSCVDIWAPGANITTADKNGALSTIPVKGTSLSAGMVSGAAAIVLAAHPGYGPAEVEQALVDASTKGVVANTNSARDGLLFIEQPPGSAPSNLTATANNDGTIALRWDAVSEPNVHYIVSSRDATAGDTEFVPWEAPVFGATSGTSKKLTIGHRYEFVVAAANTAGTGPQSNTASATAVLPPPPAPTGLTATSKDDGSIDLSWSSLGPNIWYWVYQRDITAGETEATRLEIPITSGTAMNAKYLLHGHQYEFLISATNEGGEGPRSAPATATSSYPPPAAPTNLTARAGDGEVALTWQASATENVWYHIYQRDVTAGQAEFTKLPLPIQECCAFTAGLLTNGHTYEFKVTADHQGRESAASNLVQPKPQMPLPGQVTGLTATAQSDGSIKLSWPAPGANLWFDVYQRDVTDGQSFSKLPYPVTQCCTFSAKMLTHNHAYEFKIVATNAAGAGPASAVAGATARYSPPTAPGNLRGETGGDGTIHLDWDPPAAGNYLYWIYQRDVTAGQTAFTKGSLPTDRTEADLGFMQHNHIYEFKVSASNAGGEGPASAAVQVTSKGGLPAAPSNLTATAGDGQVALRWTASGTSGVSYTIYQRNVSAGQSWQKLPLPVTVTSMTADFLANGDTYEFKVIASNFAGNSAASNVASARPMPPLPTAPSGLSASAGNGKVTLSWTKSSTSNVSYWIETRPSGGTWDRLPYALSTCCTYTVNLLQNGTTYEFRVRATNITGDSGATNTASARPMPPFPSNATGLTATVGDGKVTLKWTASPTSGVQYYIENRASGGSWQRLPYPVGCCSFTVTMLKNGTTYEFRVRATNMTGTASGSNIASAKPMPPLPQPPSGLAVSGWETNASLAWNKSPTPYTGHNIYMRNVSRNESWRNLNMWNNGSSAQIQFLRPGDQYAFRVTAWNMTGESSPSNTVYVRLGYIGSSLNCVPLYFRGLGTTLVETYSFGVVPQSNVNVSVEHTLYLDGVWHRVWPGVDMSSSSGYWEFSRDWDMTRPPGPSVLVEVVAEAHGPGGEWWGTSTKSCKL
ncbi:fibronectin type III domain-containing protein [Micromonospora echinofusca]|uniref:fibronectin type III domain-containing protein n=1 Tax=Micromonospora echinofusca TaxID=47858 RepID=UPI0033C7996D